MGTFGKTGTASIVIVANLGSESLNGTFDSPPENCTADSITIKTSATWAGAINIQCAIYAYTDYTTNYAGALIATTEVKSVSAASTEYTFNVTTPASPSLVAGTNYYFCVVTTTDTSSGNYSLTATEDYEGIVKGATRSFSDPLASEVGSDSSIYFVCTYSIPAVGIAEIDGNRTRNIYLDSSKKIGSDTDKAGNMYLKTWDFTSTDKTRNVRQKTKDFGT